MKISPTISSLSKEVLVKTRAVISAEERMRLRLKTALRMMLASAMFWASAIVSFGLHLTTATVSAQEKDSTKREKRVKGVNRLKQNRAQYADIRTLDDVQYGIASWYGPGFHNRKTASGAKFDQNNMVAAHRTLPFGTMVKITNLRNNHSCYATITDRGPFVRSRLIDVSKAVAKSLDFTSHGTTRVRIDVVSPDLAELRPELRIVVPERDAFAQESTFALR